MERRTFLAGVAALAPASAWATTTTLGQQVLGTWQIVDAETVSVETGATAPWLGRPRPYSGVLMYQPNGWMSVQIGSPRPPVRAGAIFGGLTDAEKLAWIDTYYAYYGRFEIDEAQSKVRHHVEGSLFGFEAGVTLVRSIALRDGLLVLSTDNRLATASGATFNRLTWRRL